MTINRTSIKPSFYIELEGTDVSEYVINNGNFRPNTREKISTGFFELDKNVDPVIIPKKFIQIVDFSVQYNTKFKKFGGVISNITTIPNTNAYRIDVKSFAWLLYQTTYTGIFRNDTGKGNRKTIMTDILTEKFPNITWTDASFPAVDSSFDILYKSYNNLKPGDIFDALSQGMNRDWWIDKEGVFFCQERVYTQVNQPITQGTNFRGVPVITINNKYANFVKVFGKKFKKTIQNIYSGTGGLDEFDLNFYPEGSSDVEYSDGTRISTTMEGNEDYSSGTVYDAYFKQSAKTIKFNINTVADSDNIIVKTKVYDQIRDEVPRGAEIDRIGYEIVKEIRDDNIETTEEANRVANNYLDDYAFDLSTYFIGAIIVSDNEIQNWSAGNAIPLTINNNTNYENIVQENWEWSPINGLLLNLRFVDFEKTDSDIIKELLKKEALREQEVDNSSTNLTRFFYMGSNVVMQVRNFSLKSQDASDYRFQLQENPTLQDDRSLMSETGTIPAGGIGSGIAAEMTEDDYPSDEVLDYSINESNKYVHSWMDDWFTDWDITTGTIDLDNQKLILDAGKIWQTLPVFKDKYNSVTQATMNITYTGTLIAYLSANGSLTSETVQSGIPHTFTNSDNKGLVIKLIADTNSEVTVLDINYVKQFLP